MIAKRVVNRTYFGGEHRSPATLGVTIRFKPFVIMYTNILRSLPWLFAVLAGSAQAVNLSCKLGASRCIQSQGTEIPSKKAIEVLGSCSEFTTNDLGRVAMRMSQKELLDRSGNKITPLVSAWIAYGDLIDSPLRFERKPKAEKASYIDIKRACLELDRDFNDVSKWTK